MSKVKILKHEIEITSIKDVSKLKAKKKSKKKSEETEETETQKTIEERVVTLKLTEGKITYSLNISGKKSVHPLDYLIKPNDIGLKARLTLEFGPNPQKTLDDIS